MKITIITINYNGSENTKKLLDSLRNQTDQDFEIILIDNASERQDLENLKQYVWPGTNLNLTINPQNLGFSGGNNVGIRRALQNGADWVVLLNNDTWAGDDFITRLKADLEGKEGIVGLSLNEGDKTAYAGKIEWLKPTLAHVYESADKQNVYAIGGAMLIHKSVFEKIGLLDEKYFLYFEDAAFCVRARKNKIPVSIHYDIMLYHSVSSSTKKLGSPLILRYHYRNALYFNLKNGPWHVKLLVWPWSWIIILKQMIKILNGKNKEQSRAILNGVGDFYRKNYGKLR